MAGIGISRGDQRIQTINFHGAVGWLNGTGGGISNGAAVSGTIVFDANQNVAIFGDGLLWIVTNRLASVKLNINGWVTNYTGIEGSIGFNSEDSSGLYLPADKLFIGWGAGYGSGIYLDAPRETFNEINPANVSLTDSRWWSDRLPYTNDAIVLVSFEILSYNGAFAPLTVYGPPPALFITGSHGNGCVAYPTNADGYVLESCSDLGTNSAAWLPVTNNPVPSGTNWMVAIPPTAGKQFFRLGTTN